MQLFMTPPPRRFFLLPPSVQPPPGAAALEDALGRPRGADLAALAPYEVDRAAVARWSAAQRAGLAAEASALAPPTPDATAPTPSAAGAPVEVPPEALAALRTLGLDAVSLAEDPEALAILLTGILKLAVAVSAHPEGAGDLVAELAATLRAAGQDDAAAGLATLDPATMLAHLSAWLDARP